MTFLKAFGAFWYDFVIGDDWKIAAYVVVTIGLVATVVARGNVADTVIGVVGALVLGACFVAGTVFDALRSLPAARADDQPEQ